MTSNQEQKPPIWRDERFWTISLQVIVLVAVIAIFAVLGSNLNRNLQQTGTKFGFGFLGNPASFPIGDSPFLTYSATDPYIKALLIGFTNSMRIAISGIILTTMIGILAGIAQFSENWLLRKISLVYVEVVRNTPLLLQLFFWYFAVFFQLPPIAEKIEIARALFLSQRGIYLPWPTFPQAWLSIVVVIIAAIAAFFVWRWRTKIMVEQGASGQAQLFGLWALALIALLVIAFGFGWQAPQTMENGSISGGLRLSIEFSALLMGLVFYTGAYIAEIVRAGIQSVPKGQWEAARSLGLKSSSVMSFIVFPQALRVIIPPLNSQYQNLVKNSSLGSAIAYPELYNIANTTFNQTGRPIEVLVIIMGTYLILNLIISLSMNLLNRSVQLAER